MSMKITEDEEVVSLATEYLIGMAKLVSKQNKRSSSTSSSSSSSSPSSSLNDVEHFLK